MNVIEIEISNNSITARGSVIFGLVYIKGSNRKEVKTVRLIKKYFTV